jgi:hypothetical protein
VRKVLIGAIIVNLWQAWVDLVLAIGIPQSFFASLAQLILEQDSIPSVALVNRVCDVANERHKPNDEVDG